MVCDELDVIATIKSGGSFLFRLLTVALLSDTNGADTGVDNTRTD